LEGGEKLAEIFLKAASRLERKGEDKNLGRREKEKGEQAFKFLTSLSRILKGERRRGGGGPTESCSS